MIDNKIYDKLTELILEQGFNAVGYRPQTDCYVVYYDRTILTEKSIRDQLRPLVGESLELEAQDPPEVLC